MNASGQRNRKRFRALTHGRTAQGQERQNWKSEYPSAQRALGFTLSLNQPAASFNSLTTALRSMSGSKYTAPRSARILTMLMQVSTNC